MATVEFMAEAKAVFDNLDADRKRAYELKSSMMRGAPTRAEKRRAALASSCFRARVWCGAAGSGAFAPLGLVCVCVCGGGTPHMRVGERRSLLERDGSEGYAQCKPTPPAPPPTMFGHGFGCGRCEAHLQGVPAPPRRMCWWSPGFCVGGHCADSEARGGGSELLTMP